MSPSKSAVTRSDMKRMEEMQRLSGKLHSHMRKGVERKWGRQAGLVLAERLKPRDLTLLSSIKLCGIFIYVKALFPPAAAIPSAAKAERNRVGGGGSHALKKICSLKAVGRSSCDDTRNICASRTKAWCSNGATGNDTRRRKAKRKPGYGRTQLHWSCLEG